MKSNTNSNQENDLISFVIYYLLYLLSFGMFYYMISIKDKENPLLLYLPITYSLIRGIGDYSQGDYIYLYELLTSQLKKTKDILLIFIIYLLPYLCLLIDESKVAKDNNFYNKVYSWIILSVILTLLYANIIIAKIQKSVFYITYTCLQIVGLIIFSTSNDITNLFFYYDTIILFSYFIYLILLVFILPTIVYIVIHINIDR